METSSLDSNHDQTQNTQPTNDRGSGTSEQRRRELADFLRTRREKLKPEQVGLAQGSRRRTPGLRREEVAELAGVGTTWYTWLEQARDIQPSSEVLRRLGQALQLNPAELRHMFALAGKALPADLESTEEGVNESLSRLLNQALNVPAVLLGTRWDVLAMNEKASEFFRGLADLPVEKRNWLYYVFCVAVPRDRLEAWETNVRRLVAEFRASLSESLDNPWVIEVVDMLKRESPEFEKWWKEHDVRGSAPTVIEITKDDNSKLTLERAVLIPWQNPRLKILTFTPMS